MFKSIITKSFSFQPYYTDRAYHLRKFMVTLLLSMPFLMAQSQDFDASIQTTGLLGSGNNLPFWMTHNQLGKYATTGNLQELTEGTLSGSINWPGNLRLSYGTDLALLVTDQGVDPKIIQAYLALSGKIIRLQAGAFADEELLGGLSSTNGDLLRSLNFRPLPKVRLSTPGLIPFLFAKKWFRFSAEYDEALLTDERVIDRPHLHHKSAMFQFLTSSTTRFTFGFNHYVFWGGYSDELGQLPDQPKDYFRYVIGSAGGSEFIENEQLNVAGNQMGSYLFTFDKDFEKFHIQLRVSHPFEDGSGLGFENKDNLYTLYWKKKKQGTLLDEFLVEYLYSRHQSGDRYEEMNAGVPEDHLRGGDDYFNHYIYKTGFTFKGQSMGTPLFEPLRYGPNGEMIGVSNNRVAAIHLGAKGTFSKAISWKTLITYSHNYGIYYEPINPYRKQLYSLAMLNWKSMKHPLMLSALMGFDRGQLTTHQLGIGLQAQWTLR